MNFSSETAVILIAVSVAFPANLQAGEGGSSHYYPGTYDDFLVAKWPARGLIVRDDLFYFQGDTDDLAMAGGATARGGQDTWFNVLKVAYFSDFEILGAQYGAAVVLPYTLSHKVDATVSMGDMSLPLYADQSGLSDPYLLPVRLNWSSGRHNTSFGLGIFAPWGDYDVDRQINLGRNYWTVNPILSYTYLDQDLGWEFSTTMGVTWNFENEATNYTSGSEFHIDWLAGRHISATTAIALNGYWYEQFEDDEGDPGMVPTDGFRGRSIGLGPAIMKSFDVGGTPVSVIGKWLYDVEAENRLKGNTVMLTAVALF